MAAAYLVVASVKETPVVNGWQRSTDQIFALIPARNDTEANKIFKQGLESLELGSDLTFRLYKQISP